MLMALSQRHQSHSYESLLSLFCIFTVIVMFAKCVSDFLLIFAALKVRIFHKKIFFIFIIFLLFQYQEFSLTAWLSVNVFAITLSLMSLLLCFQINDAVLRICAFTLYAIFNGSYQRITNFPTIIYIDFYCFSWARMCLDIHLSH